MPPANTIVEPPAKASHRTDAMESFHSDFIILTSLIYIGDMFRVPRLAPLLVDNSAS